MLNWKRIIGLTLAFVSLRILNVISDELSLLTLGLGFFTGCISFDLLFPETEKE